MKFCAHECITWYKLTRPLVITFGVIQHAKVEESPAHTISSLGVIRVQVEDVGAEVQGPIGIRRLRAEATECKVK
jgi:hypothetical protein